MLETQGSSRTCWRPYNQPGPRTGAHIISVDTRHIRDGVELSHSADDTQSKVVSTWLSCVPSTVGHGRPTGCKKGPKTYNTRDSLVVTDPTTSLALTSLSMGEQTGSRIFQWVWSYVLGYSWNLSHIVGARR